MSNKCLWHINISREIILFCLILSLVIFARFLYLDADPPVNLSPSTGIETDPPAHLSYARLSIVKDNWNPYHDDRYIIYQYSVVSLFGKIVYEIFGVGLYQTNLSAVLMSILTLIIFYFIVRKAVGNMAALLALLFSGFTYLSVFLMRRPLMENGVDMLLIMGLFALIFLEKRYVGHFLFGLFTVAAIVFGKITALSFGLVPLAYYVYIYLTENRTIAVKRMLSWGSGALLLLLVWYLVVLRDYSSSITSFIQEQATGSHGAPAGFQSIKLFFLKFLDLGIDQSFFSRLPFISLACLLAVLVLTGYLVRKGRTAKTEIMNHRHIIIFTAWLVGSYLGLIPWNYQPLRYFLPMIFPIAALAAILICLIYKSGDRVHLFIKSRVFSLLVFVSLTLVLYQLYQVFWAERTPDSTFWWITPYLILISLAITVLYYAIAGKYYKTSVRFHASARIIIIVCLIGGSFGYQAWKIYTWSRLPLFTTRQASRDVGLILSPGAVLMGSYGPALAMENRLGSIINFIGTTNPDSDLFRNFPATHLALDSRNEKATRQLYPELMEQAKLITKYSINCEHVAIYLIADATGNSSAAAYKPSLFEQSCLTYWRNQADSSHAFLQKYLALHPADLSANKRAGIYALGSNSYQDAVDYFERAIEFSPTDFGLHDLAGKAYLSLGQATKNSLYLNKAHTEFELSKKYSFGRQD